MRITKYMLALGAFIFGMEAGSPSYQESSGVEHAEQQSFFQDHKIKLLCIFDFVTGLVGPNPHVVVGEQVYAVGVLQASPQDTRGLISLSMLLNIISIPILFALVPATPIGALIAFASMLIGGSLMEYAIKSFVNYKLGADYVNAGPIFLRHIPISLGAGLHVLLYTIPWALTISAVVAAAYFLVWRFIIIKDSLSDKDFIFLISPTNMLSISLLSSTMHVGFIIALTIALQVANFVYAFIGLIL